MMSTSVAVYKDDLITFVKLKREYEIKHLMEKDINAQQFFRVILTSYERAGKVKK